MNTNIAACKKTKTSKKLSLTSLTLVSSMCLFSVIYSSSTFAEKSTTVKFYDTPKAEMQYLKNKNTNKMFNKYVSDNSASSDSDSSDSHDNFVNSPRKNQFSFAAIGDQDYDTISFLGGIAPSDVNKLFTDQVADIVDKKLPFTIHIGDIMVPFPHPDVDICTKSDYKLRKKRLDPLPATIVTFGDNDWSECFQAPTLAYAGWNGTSPIMNVVDPNKLLDDLRDVYFKKKNKSQGHKPIRLKRQDGYPENVIYMYGDVVFVTMHIVGSVGQNSSILGSFPHTDNCQAYIYDPNGPLNTNVPAMTSFIGIPINYPLGVPTNLVADNNGNPDCSEANDRKLANLTWLKKAYDIAEKKQAKAMVIAFHAQLKVGSDGRTVRDLEFIEFQDYITALRTRGQQYAVPTLHIYGDSHSFMLENPYQDDNGNTIEHLLRLEVFGPTFSEGGNRWVKVNVDTNSANVFSIDTCAVSTGICTPIP